MKKLLSEIAKAVLIAALAAIAEAAGQRLADRIFPPEDEKKGKK